MRIARPLRSAIQLRANDRTAALLALQTEKDGMPLIEAIEPVSRDRSQRPPVTSATLFASLPSS
jgi:hypothetical protein